MQQNNPLSFLLRFLNKSLHLAGFSILLSSIAILLGVGLIGTSAYLISYAALQPSIAVLNIPIVGVRFFGISKSLFRYLERLASHEVNFRLLSDLRIWIYQRFVHLIPGRKEMKRTGDLMARVVEDVEILEFFFIRVVNPPLTALLTILIVGFFLGSINIQLTGLYFFLTLVSWLLMLVFSYIAAEKASRQYLNIRADVHAEVSDILNGLSDILMYQPKNTDFSTYIQAENRYQQTQMRVSVTSGWINALLVILTQGSMIIMLVMGIQLVSQGIVPGLLLAVIPLMTVSSYDSIQPLNLSAQQYHLSCQGVTRILEISSESKNQIKRKAEAIDTSEVISMEFKDLQITDVSYSYDADIEVGVSHITVDIRPGKKVAIVGPSGAGKTTIARLILGDYEPDQGKLFLNGRPYTDFSKSQITSLSAYAGASPYLLNVSIRENFQYIIPEISDETIIAYIQQTQMYNWLMGLEAGLDTVVGERGVRMSEGERRRLDLARMLILKRPVLILDEPYANQDITNQQLLSSLFHNLQKDIALIMITHRLLDLDKFNEILVMDKGSIVDRGDLDSLRSKEGLFKRMWDQQKNMLFDQNNGSS